MMELSLWNGWGIQTMTDTADDKRIFLAPGELRTDVLELFADTLAGLDLLLAALFVLAPREQELAQLELAPHASFSTELAARSASGWSLLFSVRSTCCRSSADGRTSCTVGCAASATDQPARSTIIGAPYTVTY